MKNIGLIILITVLLIACKSEKSNMKSEHTLDTSGNTELVQNSSDSNSAVSSTDWIALAKEIEERPGLEPHPELPWHVNGSIYEVNTRQYSKEGTFAKVTEQLSRLASMGTKIVWLMPVQPIGKVNRKGGMGSPYSVADFTAINPDLGTPEDLKNLISTAHGLGQKVILDWVANHAAFDNVWAADHLDYFTLRDGKQIVALGEDGNATDWTDVADLNYENQAMRAAMIDALAYWVREFDIDGYRCDVAGLVPLDFWKEATETLAEIKPDLFWLAEWEDPKMHAHFNMTYAWELHHIFNAVAQGKSGTEEIVNYLVREGENFPPDAYRMYFTTNHDENSWNGTIAERMGENGDAMTALAFMLPGMPLVYSGQEAASNKRLAFFEKDEIDWSNKKKIQFYQKLLVLRMTNKSMWNGPFGGQPEFFASSGRQIGFVRKKGPDATMFIANFDSEPAVVHVDVNMTTMTDIFKRTSYDFSKPQQVTVPAHGYLVLQ